MRKLCCASALALVAACGGGGHDVDPAIIVGGGVTDPGIDGEVNVFVIDEDTDAPLAGATVRVGAVEGTTDAAGLFVATGELVGKQTIVARATGYAASVWVGVDGANVTIPMTAARRGTWCASRSVPPFPRRNAGGWWPRPEGRGRHIERNLGAGRIRPRRSGEEE